MYFWKDTARMSRISLSILSASALKAPDRPRTVSATLMLREDWGRRREGREEEEKKEEEEEEEKE